MTKEQAKKSLHNTKVYVAGKSKEIQEKLFELGFRWQNYDSPKIVNNTDGPFLFIREDIITWSNSMNTFVNNEQTEISADYIIGLTWNEKKPQYQFKPFDKVLVRDFDEEDWYAAFYSHQDCDGRFITNGGWHLNQCIPYKGNEELVGTTNKK